MLSCEKKQVKKWFSYRRIKLKKIAIPEKLYITFNPKSNIFFIRTPTGNLQESPSIDKNSPLHCPRIKTEEPGTNNPRPKIEFDAPSTIPMNSSYNFINWLPPLQTFPNFLSDFLN